MLICRLWYFITTKKDNYKMFTSNTMYEETAKKEIYNFYKKALKKGYTCKKTDDFIVSITDLKGNNIHIVIIY